MRGDGPNDTLITDDLVVEKPATFLQELGFAALCLVAFLGAAFLLVLFLS